MWHRRSAVLALLVLVAGGRTVAQPSQKAPIDDLMRRLASVQQSRARFVEEKTLAALTEPVRSEGYLVYRRPTHLEKVATGPVPESLMVDGDRLSVVADGQQPRLIDLGSEPALAGLVDAVRGTLSGDLPELQRHYRVAMRGDLAAWQLTLTPAGAPLSDLLRQVVVEGAGTALRRVVIDQANGDRSVMTISAPS